VVRDMQYFARLDAQTASSVRLDRVVATVVELEASAAATRSTTITTIAGPPTAVLIDYAQLETALRELVDNAVRFSPTGSRVEVTWRHLEPNQVALEVDDQGSGIAPELSGRILRPFFSTSTHGTGLGLNIVARTAAIAGGELRWANLEGGGARFQIILPRLECHSA